MASDETARRRATQQQVMRDNLQMANERKEAIRETKRRELADELGSCGQFVSRFGISAR